MGRGHHQRALVVPEGQAHRPFVSCPAQEQILPLEHLLPSCLGHSRHLKNPSFDVFCPGIDQQGDGPQPFGKGGRASHDADFLAVHLVARRTPQVSMKEGLEGLKSFELLHSDDVKVVVEGNPGREEGGRRGRGREGGSGGG